MRTPPPRFRVERTPLSWRIHDERRQTVDVVVFALEAGVAHARATVDAAVAPGYYLWAVYAVERKLRRAVRAGGFTVPVAPDEVERRLYR